MGIYKYSKQIAILALLWEMQQHTWMSKQFHNVWWRHTWTPQQPAVPNTSEVEICLRKVPPTACALVKHALMMKGHLVVTAWSRSRLLSRPSVPRLPELRLHRQCWPNILSTVGTVWGLRHSPMNINKLDLLDIKGPSDIKQIYNF